MENLQLIKNLVGDISIDDLKYVDYSISKDLGIFIPSVGFCGYAVKKDHTHPAYSFVIMLTKNQNILKAKLQPDNENYLAAMLAPHIPHTEEAGDSFVRYIALFVSRELMETTYKMYTVKVKPFLQWHEFLISKDIMVLINRFSDEFQTKKPGYQKIMDALAVILTNDLIRYAFGCGSEKNRLSDNDIRRVEDYIHQYFSESISISFLADLSGMSNTSFLRKFKANTGMSPIHYLIKVRLNKAKKLIGDANLNMTEIALQCGFSSSSHLSSCFKKYYKITPTEYKVLLNGGNI